MKPYNTVMHAAMTVVNSCFVNSAKSFVVMVDVQQSSIPSCQVSDIAVRVATRVVGSYPHREQILVDAGWTAVSLDGKGMLPNGSFCIFYNEPMLKYVQWSLHFKTAHSARKIWS